MENEQMKAPTPNQAPNQMPNQEEDKKKKKKILIPIVCGIGAAALAGAIVGIVFGVKGCSGGGSGSTPWWENTSNLKESDIGKEETIKINGKDHKVRLIGIEHDHDTSGEFIHTTWEFVNVITKNDGTPLTIKWSETNNYAYTTSNLHDYLELEAFLSLFPEGLQKKLRYPEKATFRGVAEYDEKDNRYVCAPYGAANFFPLSYYEMFGETHPTEVRPHIDKEVYYSDQTRYTYFTNHPEKTNLVKCPVGSTTPAKYWLTSPYRGDAEIGSSEGAIAINEQGDPSAVLVNTELAIAPAFCL